MRSRYSAYALGKVEYILATTHPQHLDAAKPLKEWQREIEHFCFTTTFKKLEIIEVQEGDNQSFVKFKVFLEQQGRDFSFIEKGCFEKKEGRWLYLSGQVLSD